MPINDQDGWIRTTAQRPNVSNPQDTQIRTTAQRVVAAGGFKHSFGVVF